MAVDIYVMPLTSFQCGEFLSPLQQALGPENVVRVSPGGIERTHSPTEDIGGETVGETLTQLIADQTTTELIAAVKAANPNAEVAWQDAGEQVFAQQAYYPSVAQAYARWLSYQGEPAEFVLPESGDIYEHAVWERTGQRLQFPHLILHDCYYGYYFPCDFPTLILTEFTADEDFSPTAQTIGSSFRLRAELTEIGATLGLRWDDTAGLVGEPDLPESESLQVLVDSLRQLSEAAAASCSRRLPIIFDG